MNLENSQSITLIFIFLFKSPSVIGLDIIHLSLILLVYFSLEATLIVVLILYYYNVDGLVC